MHPKLNFHFFQISSYSFFTFVALAVVIIGSYWFARKNKFKTDDSLLMIIGMGLSVFIGARLFNILVNYSWYAEDLSRIYDLSTKGFSLYGGIAMAMIVGFIISRIRKIPLLKFSDIIIPFVGIGIAIMRIGCFLHGCCFGMETDLPWGVTFPKLSPAHMHQMSENIFSLAVSPVHPTQIYEFFAALVGSLIVFIILGKKRPMGTASLFAAIWFSGFRWLNMQWRVLPYDSFMTDYFYPLFYATIIVGCSVWLYRINRKIV